MRTRPLLLIALLVVSVGAAHAWPPMLPRDAPAPTLDQLIDRLAEVRAQETGLQARRADLERQVRDRLAEQARRLEKVGVSAAAPPILPPFHSVDIDRPVVRVQGQAPANVGLPPEPLPEPIPGPVARDIFMSGSVGIDPFDYRERGLACAWPRTGALADRFDALGGLPVAYNRWWRDTARHGSRGPEPLFHMGYAGFFGGN